MEESIRQDIENRFTYHTPSPEQINKYASIRDKAKEVGFCIAEWIQGTGEEPSTDLDELYILISVSSPNSVEVSMSRSYLNELGRLIREQENNDLMHLLTCLDAAVLFANASIARHP